jgi:hypothetical protein
LQDEWCKKYLVHLKNNDKYVDMVHPGSKAPTLKYDGPYPDELNVEQMITELNDIV